MRNISANSFHFAESGKTFHIVITMQNGQYQLNIHQKCQEMQTNPELLQRQQLFCSHYTGHLC